MKQRISVEQLLQLNKEQRRKLREWWKPDIDDVFIWHEGKREHRWIKGDFHDHDYWRWFQRQNDKKSDLPLLNIGQMIELLDIELMNPYPSNWEVEYYQGNKLCITSAGELCDALWSAVKEVL
jgi:hypothetical protein